MQVAHRSQVAVAVENRIGYSDTAGQTGRLVHPGTPHYEQSHVPGKPPPGLNDFTLRLAHCHFSSARKAPMPASANARASPHSASSRRRSGFPPPRPRDFAMVDAAWRRASCPMLATLRCCRVRCSVQAFPAVAVVVLVVRVATAGDGLVQPTPFLQPVSGTYGNLAQCVMPVR